MKETRTMLYNFQKALHYSRFHAMQTKAFDNLVHNIKNNPTSIKKVTAYIDSEKVLRFIGGKGIIYKREKYAKDIKKKLARHSEV